MRDGDGGGGTGGGTTGPILAFGLLLPQHESLQLLYAGMQYDNPVVRQSNSYFQVRSACCVVPG